MIDVGNYKKEAWAKGGEAERAGGGGWDDRTGREEGRKEKMMVRNEGGRGVERVAAVEERRGEEGDGVWWMVMKLINLKKNTPIKITIEYISEKHIIYTTHLQWKNL